MLKGLQGIPKAQRNRPCMLCDGDTFYTADIVSRYREVSATHNGTFCFTDTQPKPIYSYVTVNCAHASHMALLDFQSFSLTDCV